MAVSMAELWGLGSVVTMAPLMVVLWEPYLAEWMASYSVGSTAVWLAALWAVAMAAQKAGSTAAKDLRSVVCLAVSKADSTASQWALLGTNSAERWAAMTDVSTAAMWAMQKVVVTAGHLAWQRAVWSAATTELPMAVVKESN